MRSTPAQLFRQDRGLLRRHPSRKARSSGLVVRIFFRCAPGTSRHTSRVSMSWAGQATALGPKGFPVVLPGAKAMDGLRAIAGQIDGPGFLQARLAMAPAQLLAHVAQFVHPAALPARPRVDQVHNREAVALRFDLGGVSS